MGNGIDVSRYQGNIDFKKVKEQGFDFVMINAGYGRFISQKDKYFEQNYKNAKENNLNIGAYWYSYATSAEQAIEEAKTFLDAINGKSFQYPLAFDIEDPTQVSLSNTVIGEIINAFCEYVENEGYYVSIYSYANFLETKVPREVKEKYDVWLAEYDVETPSYGGNYGIWQYSSKGKVNGISTNVDLDYSYKDYPTIMVEKGLNGFSKAEEILDRTGFKKGEKSLGILAMKQLLRLAHEKNLVSVKVLNDRGFGGGTEIAVNELLKSWGYKQNSIAGTNFIKRLGEIL